MLTQTPDTMNLLQNIAQAHAEHDATALLLKTRKDDLRRQIIAGRNAGLTLQQIGELLGISRQRVDQFIKS